MSVSSLFGGLGNNCLYPSFCQPGYHSLYGSMFGEPRHVNHSYTFQALLGDSECLYHFGMYNDSLGLHTPWCIYDSYNGMDDHFHYNSFCGLGVDSFRTFCPHYKSKTIVTVPVDSPFKSKTIVTVPVDSPCKSKTIITVPVEGPSNHLDRNSSSVISADISAESLSASLVEADTAQSPSMDSPDIAAVSLSLSLDFEAEVVQSPSMDQTAAAVQQYWGLDSVRRNIKNAFANLQSKVSNKSDAAVITKNSNEGEGIVITSDHNSALEEVQAEAIREEDNAGEDSDNNALEEVQTEAIREEDNACEDSDGWEIIE